MSFSPLKLCCMHSFFGNLLMFLSQIPYAILIQCILYLYYLAASSRAYKVIVFNIKNPLHIDVILIYGISRKNILRCK